MTLGEGPDKAAAGSGADVPLVSSGSRAQAADRGVDVDDPRLPMRLAAERLSTVRYVFLVQIEDGIASADEQASLEYADAVLMGWPEEDSDQVRDPPEDSDARRGELLEAMERHIATFRNMEHEGDLPGMADTLIRITDQVAGIRRIYQPSFELPTFAEIRRFVQGEWDEAMGRIDADETDSAARRLERDVHDADARSHGRDVRDSDAQRETGGQGHGRDGAEEGPDPSAADGDRW
nr:phosphoribosylglycinamide synthetase [uncultured Bifidobacterium sp.]